ncbi:MAG: hypothetical protein K8F91_10115 [Candidatus Obscuribacterales bacterium]|nr:hypothetical protein [Candidatus Obscuribacterales bacterium]
MILTLFLTWSPGRELLDGSHDRRTNGLWMQHGWLGDDAWFKRYGKDVSKFRDIKTLNKTAEQLREHHITDIYPHLCPCSTDGAIAQADKEQVERFLDAFTGFRIMPWVGGVNGSSAIINNKLWRKTFAQSCNDLLVQHPRLAGVHINIEPMRSGNQDYLLLLDELRTAIPPGKLLSVAAYPPPTFWQPVAAVHWDEDYSRAVAKRVDQATVMMYDTSLRVPALYRQLMKDWTRQALTWYKPKEVLLGIPAYDDKGVSYHDPQTENLSNALMGIHAGLDEPLPVSYRGVSVYCDWEMTPAKWQQLRRQFCAPDNNQ